MPIYEYECTSCGCRFEVRQSFSDKPASQCQTANCKGSLRRVFSPPAIIFKGKGFHVNDYGRGQNGSRTSSASSEASSGSKEPAAAKAD